MWYVKNKVNEQTKQKQTHRCRGQAGGCKGGDVGDWVKKVKGLRSIDWRSQDRHGAVKYSIRGVVDTILITVCGARWVLKITGNTL